MKYSYRVKANGKWYEAGEEVPEENPIQPVAETDEKQETEPEKKSGRKKNP